jgi:hypothetical protein
MTKQEMIGKLKKPTLAQPFGLLPESQQDILETAGKANCLYYGGSGWGQSGGSWPQSVGARFADDSTYILKPDYQPESEYVDVPVCQGYGVYLGFSKSESTKDILPFLDSTLILRTFLNIHVVVSISTFVDFFVDAGTPGERPCRPEEVATKIREGYKVVARFVKE